MKGNIPNSSFSIIICTYNPKEDVFIRLLGAIDKLDTKGISFEIIIVDNNSKIPLSTINFVQEFLFAHSNAILILEKKPGLTSARIAGIEHSKYHWLVFFDDDNEPKPDYLKNALLTISEHPKVGVWGPGEIQVEFLKNVPQWLEKEKSLFQERKEKQTKFDCSIYWQDFYPFGTGLIILKEIAEIYSKRVLQKRYTLSDRKGKSLASGGDVQLVLTGIEQGYNAGIIKDVQLSHLIDESKTTMNYLLKMQYGTASAYVKAHNQVFIHQQIPTSRISNKQILIIAYGLLKIQRKQMNKQVFQLFVASKMGEINARISNRKPFLIFIFELFIHV